jgi:MoaA/NifB/PqqE/SkfB family radical SAM enzyme
MSSRVDLDQKVYRHLTRLRDVTEYGFTYPVTWELDPTNDCNHDCVGCFAKGAGGRSNNESLTWEEATNYVDQIAQLRAKAIVLTGGGDPMFNKITPDLMKYIRSKGLNLGMITNGSIFNDESIAVAVENCNWIRISLDAGTPEVFSEIRKVHRRQFWQVLRNLRKLRDKRDELGTSCTLGTGFLTSALTMPGLVNFTSLSKQAGADYVQIRPFHGDFTIPLRINECLAMQDETFQVHYAEHKYNSGYTKKYTRCEAQNLSGVINVHKVYLCCHMRGVEKYELGDLRHSSLSNIWHSMHRKDVVDNLDFADCIAHCRLDKVNQTIHALQTPVEDENFI